MKFQILVAGLAAVADAHYIFSKLLVNGRAVGQDFTYIRKNTNSYQPSFGNVLSSPDYRCNKGAGTGRGTQTYTIAAGSKIGSSLAFNEKIEHPGPGWIFMSKAPTTAAAYDGSGGWFKIAEFGVRGNGKVDSAWSTWQKSSMEGTIPKTTPPGEYLVRFEHFAIHENHVNKPQFYMECAQVKVTGSGGGTPGPLVKIPGVLTTSSPAVKYNKWGAGGSYPMPAPAVWTG